MPKINGKMGFRLLVIVGGQVAIILVLLDIIPFLTAFLGLIYGILIPGIFLHAYYRRSFSVLTPNWALLLLTCIFVPVWLAFSAIWLIFFGNLITQGIAGIISILIITCTGAVIIRDRYPAHFLPVRVLRIVNWRPVLIGSGIALVLCLGMLLFGWQSVAEAGTNGAMTEFFLPQDWVTAANPQGGTEATDLVRLPLNIVNREGVAGDYQIVATLGGNRAVAQLGPIHLENNGAWSGEIIFSPESDDHEMVQIYLERIGFPWPYRMLQLWIGTSGSIADAISGRN